MQNHQRHLQNHKKCWTPFALLTLLLPLFLVGCSTTQKQKQPEPPLVSKKADLHWENHSKQVEQHSQWKAKGRLAVTQQKKGGNASFIWQHLGDHYNIKLHGPFGSGAITITGGPKQVLAQEANGKTHHATSAEQLMQKLIGWNVPLTGLQYWIKGIPVPTEKVSMQQLSEKGLLQHLEQGGWIIDYEEYTQSTLPLPRKMRLHNPKLKIKLIITNWS